MEEEGLYAVERELPPLDERMRFVARLIDADWMSELRREFGISRKTGYKIWERYREVGIQGVTDRSRRPYCKSAGASA